MYKRYLVTQLQVQVLILATAGLKEYEADWLKNTDTVLRDATGKFASKASSVAQQTKKKAEDVVKETQSRVTNFKQAVENLAKDPKEIKRRVNSKLLDLTGKGLDKLIEKNPGLANSLTSSMFGVDAQKARDRVAQMYATINPDLAKEIKKDPFQEIVDNARAGKLKKEDLLAGFEYAGYKYNKMIDDLNHLEGQPDYIKVLGKVATTSIPVATFLAATLAPEVAIGMLLGDSIELILASAAVGQVASAGANKAMDQMEVKNPLVRMGVELTVGLGAGISVSRVAKSLERRAASKAVAKTELEVGAKTEELEAVAKREIEASERFIKKPFDPETSKLKGIVSEEALNKLRLNDVDVRVQSRGRTTDYSWRKVEESGLSKGMPPEYKNPIPTISGTTIKPYELLDGVEYSETPVFSIVRDKGKLAMHISNIPTNRVDEFGREINDGIHLTVADTPDCEKTLRSIASSVLKGDLNFHNVIESEEELFSATKKGLLERIADAIDVVPDSRLTPDVKPKLGGASKGNLHALADELATGSLPPWDGPLVALSGCQSPEVLSEAGVWRAITTLAKDALADIPLTEQQTDSIRKATGLL